MKAEEIKKAVRDRYGEIAVTEDSCCGPLSACYGNAQERDPAKEKTGRRIGYSEAELRSVPEGTNLGLGCGNPIAHGAGGWI